MSINYTIQSDGDVLRVTTSGKDDNLEEVLAYTQAVLAAGLAANSRKVLLDERDLEYAIGIYDTYQLATFITSHTPRIIKVALVYNPAQVQAADFWETVVINRGLQVKIFPTLAAAEEWLGV